MAMVWEGRGIIKASRAMIGPTEPLECGPGVYTDGTPDNFQTSPVASDSCLIQNTAPHFDMQAPSGAILGLIGGETSSTGQTLQKLQKKRLICGSSRTSSYHGTPECVHLIRSGCSKQNSKQLFTGLTPMLCGHMSSQMLG